MIKIEGKGGISATIIADSVSSVNDKRITTFELVYHRYIHAEFMTHRMFSRNAASSRAIPVERMLELVRTQPAMPIHWGANQAGMQAVTECSNYINLHIEGSEKTREEWWLEAAEMAAHHSEEFSRAGYHKQIVNRLTEPFQMMKVVCTATEYENFFWLRDHEAAQPEIAELARCMREAREQSEPEVLYPGEWHTPYVEHYREYDTLYYLSPVHSASDLDDDSDYFISLKGRDGLFMKLSVEEALKVSSSCAAQVSYRRLDESLDKAVDIYNKLIGSDRKHASPFEHQATTMLIQPEFYQGSTLWQEGVTHMDKNYNFWSGNFCGWVQHRQLIEDHVKND